jgi:UDP-2-acetamido-3-amino-2,3-dideoxy-glucuronate N-acetyltransferase
LIHHGAFVHSKAHVDRDTVQLGFGTRVWQFASITRGTIMGENCSVSPFAMLDGSVYGDRVIVSAGVACGAGFKIGSDVFLGPNCCLANDMWPASNKDGYDDEKLRSGEYFSVIVDDGATIGAGAVVLPGVRIGRGAIVAAGAVVDRNVPDGFLWRRNGYLAPVPVNRNAKRMRWAS